MKLAYKTELKEITKDSVLNESINTTKTSKSLIISLILIVIFGITYTLISVINKYIIIEDILISAIAILLISTLLPYLIFDKKEKNKFDIIVGYGLILLTPIIIVQYITIVPYISYTLKNILIVYGFFYLLLLIFRNIKIACTIIFLFSLFVCIMNDVLMQVRGTSLAVSDIYAIKTAFTVSTNYEYELISSTVTAILVTILFMILIFSCKFKFSDIKFTAVKYVFISAIFVLCTTLSYLKLTNSNEIDTITWKEQDNDKYTGMYYNIFDDLINSRYKKPKNYSAQSVEKILNRYSNDEYNFEPNIIVVMNESFSDLKNIVDFTTNQEVIPFIENLKKNTMKGTAIVSEYGAGTCNSEFEFLSGMTTAFMPLDSYVYLQYINSNTKTLAWEMDNDYDKVYIHPYIASNYKRSTVFKFLGFDEFLDGLKFSQSDHYEDKYNNRITRIEYSGVQLLRDYISDKDVYDRMIEVYENKPENKKIFEFAITMQNHSPYNYDGDDFETYIYANEDADNDFLSQYLTLTNITDSETKRLIEYFEKVDEETVIVFFGDHKPFFETICNKEIQDNSLDDIRVNYSTPFFIWTNYETEYEDVGEVSLNYLSVLMKKHSGMPLNKFDKFRLELYEKYPVLSRKIVIDSNGNMLPSYTYLYDKTIDEYQILQYYYMTGNGYDHD